MGRTLHDDRGDPIGRLLTEGRQWQRSHQHMEHRTVTSFLSLKLDLTVCFHSMLAPTSTLARTLSVRVAQGLHEGVIPPLFFTII